jgi:hypothetical protein
MMDMYGGKKATKMTGKKKVSKAGMHRMPDGTMMKNSAMKKSMKKRGKKK